MLIRVFVLAALVVAFMAVVKDGRVMRDAGLFGSCSVVHGVNGTRTDWRACRSGKLSGPPDLTRQSCRHWGMRDGVDYWRCAASVEAAYKP
jgi:hypothetical protein